MFRATCWKAGSCSKRRRGLPREAGRRRGAHERRGHRVLRARDGRQPARRADPAARRRREGHAARGGGGRGACRRRLRRCRASNWCSRRRGDGTGRAARSRGGTSATGQHTIYLEDLDVKPGDFVTYYARARDVGRGKPSTETRSDIFFLEVRPFNEEFEAAQSQAGMSGGSDGHVRRSRPPAEGHHRRHVAARQAEGGRRGAIGAGHAHRRRVAGGREGARPRNSPPGSWRRRADQHGRGRGNPRTAAARFRCHLSQPPPNPMQRAVEAMGRAQAATRATGHLGRPAARERRAQRVAAGTGRGEASAGRAQQSSAGAAAGAEAATRTCRRCSTASCSGSSRPTTSSGRRRSRARRRRKTRRCGGSANWRPGRTR